MERLRKDLMGALTNFDLRVSDYIRANEKDITDAIRKREQVPDSIANYLDEANEVSKIVGETIKLIDSKLKKQKNGTFND